MNCKEAEKYLFEIAEGCMQQDNNDLILAHVKSCDACKQKEMFMRLIQAEIEQQKKISPPLNLNSRIMEQIAESNSKNIVVLQRSQVISRIAAAIIIGIGLTAGIYIGNEAYYVDNSEDATLNEYLGVDSETDEAAMEVLFIADNTNLDY